MAKEHVHVQALVTKDETDIWEVHYQDSKQQRFE